MVWFTVKPRQHPAPVPDISCQEQHHRADGSVGTRIYLGVLAAVNFSGSVSCFIAEAVEKSGVLAACTKVDGVVPLAHGIFCGSSGTCGDYDIRIRTVQD